MKKNNLLQGDAMLVEPVIANEQELRPGAALGNMQAYLSLENPTNHWISVGRADLENILKYVSELENRSTKNVKNKS